MDMLVRHMHVNTHIYIYMHMYIHAFVDICRYISYTHVYVYTCRTDPHTHIDICVCVNILTYIEIHAIDLYLHTFANNTTSM